MRRLTRGRRSCLLLPAVLALTEIATLQPRVSFAQGTPPSPAAPSGSPLAAPALRPPANQTRTAAPSPRAEIDALLARARDLYGKGLTKRAIEALDAAIELDARDVRPLAFKAQVLERQSDLPGTEAALTKALEISPDEVGWLMQRGLVRMRRADFVGAIADFDRFADLRPGSLPQLWQRGIALFYAGRYDDGRKQFEIHRTVNPHDVENSAWHFACVAWAENFETARKQLLACDGDSRIPMTQVQALLAGQAAPAALLKAAAATPEGPRRREAEFYAHLYLAMYHGAERKPELETRHAAEAARLGKEFGIMGEVARLHADWITARLRREKR